MKREDITILAQLMTSMKDAVEKLGDAEKEKDAEKLNTAKKEIVSFQKQIDRIL